MSAKDSSGLTPLMYAAKKKKLEVVDKLTLRNNNLNEEDSNRNTILIQRLIEDDVKMARKLIVRGADINYVNSNGMTALHICVLHKKELAIEWLLKQKKLDRHIIDFEGKDPCDLAKEREDILKKFPIFTDC